MIVCGLNNSLQISVTALSIDIEHFFLLGS